MAAAIAANFLGMAGLFAFTFVVHMLVTGFVAARIGFARAVTSEHRSGFSGIPRTSPEAAALDPRANDGSDPVGKSVVATAAERAKE